MNHNSPIYTIGRLTSPFGPRPFLPLGGGPGLPPFGLRPPYCNHRGAYDQNSYGQLHPCSCHRNEYSHNYGHGEYRRQRLSTRCSACDHDQPSRHFNPHAGSYSDFTVDVVWSSRSGIVSSRYENRYEIRIRPDQDVRDTEEYIAMTRGLRRRDIDVWVMMNSGMESSLSQFSSDELYECLKRGSAQCMVAREKDRNGPLNSLGLGNLGSMCSNKGM